jgi:small-conductance mechanosensitive channel
MIRKIRVMDTEFKNWLNEEVFRVPNSTVMSSMISNITYEDDSYKIYEYIDVDYGADIEKAKEIMLDVVSSHPQVITDGSKSGPSFRFSSMEASAIRLRVSYILTDHELSYTVPCQIRELIYKRFRAEGIKVPHNIIDVHVEE